MNGFSKPTFAYGGVWLSAALNVGFMVGNLAIASYRTAALQSLIVAGCGVWLWMMPKVEAWFDARIGEATAQRQIAEFALAEMERQKRAGGRVNMTVDVPVPARMN